MLDHTVDLTYSTYIRKIRVSAQLYLSLKRLVDFLHLGSLVSSALDFLQRWEVVVIAQPLVIVINAEAELDHSVDAAGKLGRLVQVEAGGEERSVEEQPDQVLHRFVRLVGSSLLLGRGVSVLGRLPPLSKQRI